MHQGPSHEGDAVAMPPLAGLVAAKRTSALIPLRHSVPLNSVHVQLTTEPNMHTVLVTAECQACAHTGVETLCGVPLVDCLVCICLSTVGSREIVSTTLTVGSERCCRSSVHVQSGVT